MSTVCTAAVCVSSAAAVCRSSCGQLLVERLGGRPVDEPGLGQVAVGLQLLHGLDGQRAVDPVDRTVVVADLLQLGLQRRRVRGHLLDRLGLLLVGEAARVGEQLSQAIWSANAAELYSAVASASGVASVIPSAVWARSSSACWTRSIVAGGTIVVVVVVAAARRAGRHARRGGDRLRQRRLGVDELLSGLGEGRLRRLDVRRRRRHRLAWLDEVGAARLDVADGGGVIGEQLAVAVERLDVALGVAAELLAGRLERLLRSVTPDSAAATRASAAATGSSASLVAGASVVVASSSSSPHADAKDDDRDQRGHGPAPPATRARAGRRTRDASMHRHGG